MVISVATPPGDFLYPGSDFMRGAWITTMVSADPQEANWLHAITGSLSVNPGVPLNVVQCDSTGSRHP